MTSGDVVRWRLNADTEVHELSTETMATGRAVARQSKNLTLRCFAAVLVVLLFTGLASADITRDELRSRVKADLLQRNFTCEDSEAHVCQRAQKGPRPLENWEDRGCFCDNECAIYGDCCLDITPSVPQRQDLVCRQLRNYDGIYMVSQCPETWKDKGVRRLCSQEVSLTKDPFGALPVSSPKTRVTYNNYYCAMCHQDVKDMVFWKPRVECPTLSPAVRSSANLTSDGIAMDKLVQNEDGYWGLYLPVPGPNGERFHRCEIDPFFPETVEYFVRRCREATSECSSDWQDDQVAELCHSYNAYVYDFDNGVYRNPHCAICNNQSLDDIMCIAAPIIRTIFRNSFNTRAFSILLDIGDSSGSERVGRVNVCKDNQLWDPFFKKCRDVVCDAEGYELVDGVCVETDTAPSNETEHPKQISNQTSATDFLLCPKYYLNGSEFEVRENASIFVPLYDRTYQPGEYEVRDGELVICAVSSDFSKFDAPLTYVSLACLAASILCLFLHLVAFCAVPDIRNLSGKNLAALCLCLLTAYICFVVSPFQQVDTHGCTVLGVIMYTAFLASFFWMNVMAFDVFITLRQATAELRVSSGKHWKRFLLYTLYVCVMTVAIVTAAVLAENSDSIAPAYRPGFGQRVCWFSRRRALMAFFAAPLAAVMGINVVFFVGSALMIRQTTKSTASMTCGPSKINLRLYSRLAIIMGLSWILGLVAGWLDFPPLWYAFVILNTLQGVFIFVSFTMAPNVRDKVRKRTSQNSGWGSGGGRSSNIDSHVNTDSSGLTVSRTRL